MSSRRDFLATRVTGVFWQDAGLLDRRPQLIALLTTLGHPVTNFVAREPDTVGRDLDRVLGIVTGLASPQRDNPLLIQQTEGSQFLRTGTLREIAVEVLRYGQRNRYWLAVDDGRLLRFEETMRPATGRWSSTSSTVPPERSPGR